MDLLHILNILTLLINSHMLIGPHLGAALSLHDRMRLRALRYHTPPVLIQRVHCSPVRRYIVPVLTHLLLQLILIQLYLAHSRPRLPHHQLWLFLLFILRRKLPILRLLILNIWQERPGIMRLPPDLLFLLLVPPLPVLIVRLRQSVCQVQKVFGNPDCIQQ